jgi:hypothetical protein
MQYGYYLMRDQIEPQATAAFLPCSGAHPTYTVGDCRYSHVSSWSNDPDKAAGYGFFGPPSKYARECLQRNTPERERGSLRPIHRVAAHAGWTPGPMYVSDRAETGVVGIDIVGAYLASMLEPMPMLETWRTIRLQPSQINKMDESVWGLVDCTLTVPKQLHPPLATKDTAGNTMWPVGTFRYVFPTNVLRAAVERCGVTIDAIHGCQIASASPWLTAVSQEITEYPKWIRKHLYTRAYGAWGTIGGYRGSKEYRPTDGYISKLPGSRFYWKDETVRFNNTAPPMYRPDVSCAIASYSTVRMINTVKDLEERGKLIVAMHVDCIWYKYRDGEDLVCPEGWAVKHKGHGVFISPGLYSVGEDVGVCGHKGATTEEIVNMPRGQLYGRVWDGNVALPLDAQTACARQRTTLPVAWDGKWSPSGYWRGNHMYNNKSMDEV